MPLLEVQGVTLRFGGLVALSGVDLTLNEGQILGLIGPNGSGKTSLINVITGLYRPLEGKILFQNQDITRWRPNRICRAGIARTYQLVRPFMGMKALENVLVGIFYGRDGTTDRPEAEHRAVELLKLVGLEGRERAETSSLTIIERKRLELARALATGPRLLLLDELIAGLTLAEIDRILQTLEGIRREGVTILLIEHVMKAVMTLSDHVVVLHHGEKIAEGKPEDIVRNEDVVEAYLGQAAPA
ncbi:MAG: ABC transporter ATP-binding protein [Nitrospinota bacterium]